MTDENLLNALIVRNIADIEKAWKHANAKISAKLEEGTMKIFKEFAENNEWNTGNDDDFSSAWTASPEWKTASAEDDSYDIYLEFNGKLPSDETWLSCFINALGNPMFLYVVTDSLGTKEWSELFKAAANKEIFENFEKQGFIVERTNRNEHICIYPEIDAEALARGFEDDDISEALMPIREALDRFLKAKPLLDELCKRIRNRAAAS